jgi:protocatechuate 3,4-dioxygenase beta subunit
VLKISFSPIQPASSHQKEKRDLTVGCSSSSQATLSANSYRLLVDVKGEYIRSDIGEDQAGVDVVWDLQFINAETCDPIENLTSDIWHCNSTGVYAGVIATGNGDTADTSNINKTFLRGLQTTDAEGVVQYTSIFPGFYSGRATHVHVEAHLDGTILANGTYSGGSIAHIGQFFFDQDLITEVNTLSPYRSNTNTLTENADDRVVKAEITNGADPFLNYILLGDTVSDGLFMWVTVSVNKSASYTSSPASDLTANGGVSVSSSSSSGGVGGGNGTIMGNGTAPSGATPSGVLPSAAAGNSSVASFTPTSSALLTISSSFARRNEPFRFFF